MATIREWMIPSWRRTPVLVLSVYFLARLVYFAIYLDHSIPPDEVEHFAKTQVYGETLWIPERVGEPDSYVRATLGYEPGAYYLLAGKLAHLNVFGISDLLFLRLLSVLLGLGMVCVGWRFVERITENRIAQVLFVVMLTNTTMVVVTQSSVTYDALANFLGALALLLLLSFFIEKTAATLVGLLLCLALGTLTKTPMIPFAGFLILCLLFHERGRFRELGALLRAHFSSRSPARWISIVILVVLILLNVGLYGRNLIKFGHFVPQPEQVLTFEQIIRSPVGSREYVVSRYQRGELSGPQAMRMAGRIKLPATRRDTRNLIDYYEHAKSEGIEFQQFSRPVYAHWLDGEHAQEHVRNSRPSGRIQEEPRADTVRRCFCRRAGALSVSMAPRIGEFRHLFPGDRAVLRAAPHAAHRVSGVFDLPNAHDGGSRADTCFPYWFPHTHLRRNTLLERRPRIQQFAIAAVVGFIFIEGDFFFCIEARPMEPFRTSLFAIAKDHFRRATGTPLPTLP